MISHISGKLKKKKENSVILELNGLSYEILVPQVVMCALEKNCPLDTTVDLITFHYYQLEPSRSTPVLIGFLNEIEKEFFERFITVSGVGPKAALRALSLPISTIAQAIDNGDAALLKSLPGIGEQRAKEIIAKLQGKVGKFGLIQDGQVAITISKLDGNIKEEALEVLLQLQYSRTEAKAMIDKAIQRNPQLKSAEELLNEVYKQKTVSQKK
jgi:Holliday junction DNA helicase RuvA